MSRAFRKKNTKKRLIRLRQRHESWDIVNASPFIVLK